MERKNPMTSFLFRSAVLSAALAGVALAGGKAAPTTKPSFSPNVAADVAAPAGAEISPTSPTGNNSGSSNGATVAYWLTILHNNDGESQLINAGAGALADFGGVARFKTLVDQLKAAAATYPADPAEHGVVLISSGDNFLAGPELTVSLEAGLPLYDTLAMQSFGYTACAIGNHEFDFGPDLLEDFIGGFVAPIPPFLTANLDFTAEPGLQAQVTSGRIAKSVVVTVGTQRIGIVGATTTDLPFISSPRGVVVNPLLPAIQSEVDALVADGVNKIILTSHLQGLSSEFGLIPSLRNVDVVIGGGGGELLANPGALLVPGDTAWPTVLGGTGYPRTGTDVDGRSVPVVTTRGDYRYLGRLIVGFDATGNIVTVDGASGPVRVSGIAPDAVTPDPVVQATIVDPVAAGVAGLAAQQIAVSQIGLDGRTNEVRARETNLGNMIADSQLWQAGVLAQDFGAAQPNVALQNGGGIRNNSIFPAGPLSVLNTLEALPFANFVSIVEGVTPAQFKEILENAVSRVGLSGNGRFAQIAGFRFTWDATGVAQVLDATTAAVITLGTRVREVILNDGTVIVRNGVVVASAPNINVATIDFLARGGDQYPFRGRPFRSIGVSYQQALRNYIEGPLSGQVLSIEYAVGGEGRITRLN